MTNSKGHNGTPALPQSDQGSDQDLGSRWGPLSSTRFAPSMVELASLRLDIRSKQAGLDRHSERDATLAPNLPECRPGSRPLIMGPVGAVVSSGSHTTAPKDPSMRLPGLLARAAGASSALNVSADIPITVPSTQPPFAAPVSSQFLGMSLEFQYWPTYSGNATGQPNVYFNQLMQNLGDRTGHAPPVRVGGE